jgi:hypothetical protein
MRSRLSPIAIALVSLAAPVIANAAPPCPPEVKEARALLTTKTASASKATQPSKTQAAARGQQDIQAPRGQQDVQAPRGQQSVQAPRGQDVQQPRGQDVQEPRGQGVQAPRGQDVQQPRGQDVEEPRNVAKGRAAALTNARRLVNEAEAACKDADSARASANARAALDLLRYVP